MVWVISLLPSGQDPPDISGAIAGILNYAGGWNWILPVYEAVGLLQWYFYIYFVLVMWYLLKWFISFAPFFGSILNKSPEQGSYIGSDEKWHTYYK